MNNTDPISAEDYEKMMEQENHALEQQEEARQELIKKYEHLQLDLHTLGGFIPTQGTGTLFGGTANLYFRYRYGTATLTIKPASPLGRIRKMTLGKATLQHGSSLDGVLGDKNEIITLFDTLIGEFKISLIRDVAERIQKETSTLLTDEEIIELFTQDNRDDIRACLSPSVRPLSDESGRIPSSIILPAYSSPKAASIYSETLRKQDPTKTDAEIIQQITTKQLFHDIEHNIFSLAVELE